MMGKKLLAALAGLVCALLAAGCATAEGAPATLIKIRPSSHKVAPRPNFVFILTDDLSWNLVSHMPHVMAMEKAGERLTRYYVVDSLCCPSRSAIFTGEYPHDDGVYTNVGADGGYESYVSNGDNNKSFAVALQKAGYRTAMMGKYLNGYLAKDPPAPGWDVWDVVGDGYNEYNYTMKENRKRFYFGHKPQDYLTDVLSNKASSFISTTARTGKPFMLEVATFAPHTPFVPAPKYAKADRNLQYPKTPAYNKLPLNPPSWLKNRPPLSKGEQRVITRDYQKRVEDDLSVDDMIGRLETELRAKGLLKNTYFVFSSDNAYHMGEYRLHPGKQTAFDTDIHVPLIVTGPGVPAGTAAGQLTSNIDLCPTFEQLAGVPIPATVDGHSLAAIWHGQNPPDWAQAVLIEHHGPDDDPDDPDAQNAAEADPPSYEAIRTMTALYVRYSNGEQEYYDTAADPYELDNIAGQGVPFALKRALYDMVNCHSGVACWAASHLPSTKGLPALAIRPARTSG